MQSRTSIKLILGFVLASVAVIAQTKPAFEAATVKPAAPLDQAKLIAAAQAGGKLPIGASIGTSQADYLYLDLKSLIVLAYGVKPYQITAPDWMGTTRFDISAKFPAGATKADAPKMLQTLLEERFHLETHRTSAEHPVLALVVGKGGPKLKASAEAPVAIDENTPLAPGQRQADGPDGPMRITVDPKAGSGIVDMGLKGKMMYRMKPADQSMHIDFSMVTMSGFADMMAQVFAQLGGGGRQIVDMTGIKGNYEASLDVSLADLMAVARNAGLDVGAGAPAGNAPATGMSAAPDPGGGAGSVTDAVQLLGLKLESRKATIEQLIVDHADKTPTEN